MQALSKLAAAVFLANAAPQPAAAMDWSDTSIGYRYGSRFAEPYNGARIQKHIVMLTHASGYSYGSNFLNLDVLKSGGSDSGAREAYLLYRHTLDLGKLSGLDVKGPGVRGLGFTAGFDINTKNDPGYASRKRMLVAGPTLMLDVPGFLNVSLLALWESNRPRPVLQRYRYDTHAMLNAAWGIPVAQGWSFEGYVNYIGSKGRDEFGGATAPETNLDMQLMYDMSAVAGLKPKTLKLGIAYQYWRNKFGNPSTVPGSLAQTPMLRAEYHF
jgi:hypothetical protein